MQVGSLIVDFAVDSMCGQPADTMIAAVTASGASSSWLLGTRVIYSTVSSEEISVLGVTVTATTAPSAMISPQLSPTPRTSILFAVVVAVLTPVVLLFITQA